MPVISSIIATSIAVGTALGVGGAGLAAGLVGGTVLATAVGGAAAGIYGLAGGFSKKQLTYDPQAPAGTAASKEVAEAKAKEEVLNKRRLLADQAGTNTVLTGPMGLSDKAQTEKKTLLGG